MRSNGGSMAYISLHAGADWRINLSTYEDRTPILGFSAGSATVAVSIADRTVDTAALTFARRLADEAARFAAEVERLHAMQAASGSSNGSGEAA